MEIKQSQFGLIGLAVMGQNLVLNVESRGYRVSVFNRSFSKTEQFITEHQDKNLQGFAELKDFVQSLERPRKVMIMVQAGAAVDAVIESLLPLLEEGDLIIDGGNSLYTDTERRSKQLEPTGILFIGAGVSGGEEGALKGPSIMPGGPVSSWQKIAPIFEAISAKVDNEPCVTHIGAGGAGHYVKMVHNGIEYGDMQLICEAYHILSDLGFSPDELADIFAEWNNGELESFLIEITSHIFRQKDDKTGDYLVNVILDKAGQKGTGRWTMMSAVEQAIPLSTINSSVESRILSALKEQRIIASEKLQGPAINREQVFTNISKTDLVEKVKQALYGSKIISYAQGLDLIAAKGKAMQWDLSLGDIAKIWRGGCIIRARFLNHITAAYQQNPELSNLMLAPYFADILNQTQQSWREVVMLAIGQGIPVPAFSAALSYYDSYRSANLPANLLQAQRDFFGAHTYERKDSAKGEFFHTKWPQIID